MAREDGQSRMVHAGAPPWRASARELGIVAGAQAGCARSRRLALAVAREHNRCPAKNIIDHVMFLRNNHQGFQIIMQDFQMIIGRFRRYRTYPKLSARFLAQFRTYPELSARFLAQLAGHIGTNCMKQVR